MTIAFIQSIGGASGDMALAALLDLGLPLDFLKGELSKLGIDGYELSVTQETRREMRGSKLSVNLKSSDRLSPRALSDLVTNSAFDRRAKTAGGKRAGLLVGGGVPGPRPVPGLPGVGGTGDGGHAGGRGWGRYRSGLLWRRAGFCFPPGPGGSGASPMARRVSQPGAGHPGACRHGPGAGGPGAPHVPGRRRTDHANGSGVDHFPGGIRPPGVPGYVRRDWAGRQGTRKISPTC